MAKTIVAVYDNVGKARTAVDQLLSSGYKAEDISLVTYDESGQNAHLVEGTDIKSTATEDVSAGEGAAFGALAGLAIGLASLAIPGIGPVIAAGPIATLLTGGTIGALAGAATGSLVASLVDMGIDEEDASYYAESVRRGGAMVVVKAPDDMVETAGSVMTSCGPIDVDRSVQNWRQTGWERFDESAKPVTGSNRSSDFYADQDMSSDTPYYRTYNERT